MRRAAYQTSEFATLLGAEAKRDLHDADIAVFIWRFRHVELAFITIYLDCSIGLDGGPNVRKLRTLLAVTKALRLPWVAIGDFNVKPAEWAKTKWLEELGGPNHPAHKRAVHVQCGQRVGQDARLRHHGRGVCGLFLWA